MHWTITASKSHYPKNTSATFTAPTSMPQLFIIQKQGAHPQRLNMLTVDPIPVKPTAKGFTQPKAQGRLFFYEFLSLDS
jgi:hypothetical protein